LKVQLEKTFRFEAAHFLPKVPDCHKCRRIHGHGYVIDVAIEGEVDPELGWLIDFGDLAIAWEPIHATLDHQLLNDIEGLENPTAELLALWIWERLKPSIPMLSRVTIHETCASRCSYFGE
jgi:6-pyruvoyltetrahydropterin/6-carboxytetrahydropterin synthase